MVLLRSDLERHPSAGVTVSIPNSVKAVVDCLKHHGKIGFDLVLDALHACAGLRKCSVKAILKCAKVRHVESVIRRCSEVMV